MTPEVLIIGTIRVLGSLPVLRWPLAGAIIAILIDLSDLLLMNVIDLGGLGDYQAFDKYVDQVYMVTFLIVAWRWGGTDRAIGFALYAYRLVGFVAFELTGARELLLAFPNLFETWFLFAAAVRHFRIEFRWTPLRIVTVGGLLLVVKEAQEYALHGARLFDDITALEALRLVWRWLTGA